MNRPLAPPDVLRLLGAGETVTAVCSRTGWPRRNVTRLAARSGLLIDPATDRVFAPDEEAVVEASIDVDDVAQLSDRRRARSAAKQRAYYEQNRAEIAAKQRAYYEQNRAEIAAKQRAYREQNRAEIAAKQRAYREQNRAAARDPHGPAAVELRRRLDVAEQGADPDTVATLVDYVDGGGRATRDYGSADDRLAAAVLLARAGATTQTLTRLGVEFTQARAIRAVATSRPAFEEAS